MKLTLSLLLSAATITSTSLASHALGSDLPDSRFRVELTFHSPFLPVNPTFMNIVHFMKVVAQVEFEEQLQPRTYSAPTYRQVQITTYNWTEARFLLWGMYLAVTDMVKFYRFHNVMVKLYWDNIPVGQINLMVKPDLNLPGTTLNGTHYVIDDGQQLSLAGSNNKTKELFVKRLNNPAVQRVTGNDTADDVSIVEAVKTGNTAFGIPTISPVSSLPSALLSLRVTVDFYRVVGAKKLSRNDVFLTFFTAMLHLAKFPVENDMQFFNSKIPTIDLRVQMYETGLGCLNGQAIEALAYVPQYMMEHPRFGYKETNFNVELNGVRGCRGSVIDSTLSAG